LTAIFDLADRYVSGLADLDALLATYLGVPGHAEAMTDQSPDGVVATAELT
jgi:hypothetical protein